MLKENPVERLQHNADADGRKLDAEFSRRLLSLMPLMASVSRSLCRDTDLSEDIVQEALCKAWKARSSFRPNSNLKAWLLTIVRNTYYQHCRRAWRRVPLDEEMALNIRGPEDEQMWTLHLADTAEALGVLSRAQRKAFMLVGAGGLKYEEAAAMTDCPVGTAKSRVTRARKKVLAALEDTQKPVGYTKIPIGRAAHEIMRELDTYLKPPNRE
jgi:RNA polymerase sigma-70 factor, ECF subfamily